MKFEPLRAARVVRIGSAGTSICRRFVVVVVVLVVDIGSVVTLSIRSGRNRRNRRDSFMGIVDVTAVDWK